MLRVKKKKKKIIQSDLKRVQSLQNTTGVIKNG